MLERPLAPAGWRLRPASGVRQLDDGALLIGGSPLRLLRLSARGARLVADWFAGQPIGEGRAERQLARRLLDAGLADPDPEPCTSELTVIVPVRDRADQLRACLEALGRHWQTIVVDDGSADPAPIAAVAGRFGARCVRHDRRRGAAAARNTGLSLATTRLVAFLDSDCVPAPGFPADLLAHLGDPAVGAVAPRIVALPALPGRINSYERCRSPLDMGPSAAIVRPHGRVPFVPTAALVARRELLGEGFDEALSIGEDVDLVWRLHAAGWQTRYEPRTEVAHDHRLEPGRWWARRVIYNSSVAPLSRRHPGTVPALHMTPAAALAWGAALGGLPSAVPLLAGARAAGLRRRLRGRVSGAVPLAARLSLQATAFEGRELARALAGPWACLTLASRGRSRTLALLLGAWLIASWLEDRPELDPATYAGLRLADEAARGVGMWLGCFSERDFRSLLPAPLRA